MPRIIKEVNVFIAGLGHDGKPVLMYSDIPLHTAYKKVGSTMIVLDCDEEQALELAIESQKELEQQRQEMMKGALELCK